MQSFFMKFFINNLHANYFNQFMKL